MHCYSFSLWSCLFRFFLCVANKNCRLCSTWMLFLCREILCFCYLYCCVCTNPSYFFMDGFFVVRQIGNGWSKHEIGTKKWQKKFNKMEREKAERETKRENTRMWRCSTVREVIRIKSQWYDSSSIYIRSAFIPCSTRTKNGINNNLIYENWSVVFHRQVDKGIYHAIFFVGMHSQIQQSSIRKEATRNRQLKSYFHNQFSIT